VQLKERNCVENLLSFGSRVTYSLRTFVGSTKFRPRALDTFVPTKEGGEFGGIEHGNDLQVALHEWPILYGEILPVLMVVVLFSPVLAGPVVLYLLLTRPS
jgi:hypothetical protein